MNTDELAELQHALTQSWNVAATELKWERLRDALAEHVAYLLRHDYQRLVTSMYLLDVPEERFQDALTANDIDAAARRLADLILEREGEKLASRRAHRRATSIDVRTENGG